MPFYKYDELVETEIRQFMKERNELMSKVAIAGGEIPKQKDMPKVISEYKKYLQEQIDELNDILNNLSSK